MFSKEEETFSENNRHGIIIWQIKDTVKYYGTSEFSITTSTMKHLIVHPFLGLWKCDEHSCTQIDLLKLW